MLLGVGNFPKREVLGAMGQNLSESFGGFILGILKSSEDNLYFFPCSEDAWLWACRDSSTKMASTGSAKVLQVSVYLLARCYLPLVSEGAISCPGVLFGLAPVDRAGVSLICGYDSLLRAMSKYRNATAAGDVRAGTAAV